MPLTDWPACLYSVLTLEPFSFICQSRLDYHQPLFELEMRRFGNELVTNPAIMRKHCNKLQLPSRQMAQYLSADSSALVQVLGGGLHMEWEVLGTAEYLQLDTPNSHATDTACADLLLRAIIITVRMLCFHSISQGPVCSFSTAVVAVLHVTLTIMKRREVTFAFVNQSLPSNGMDFGVMTVLIADLCDAPPASCCSRSRESRTPSSNHCMQAAGATGLSAIVDCLETRRSICSTRRHIAAFKGLMTEETFASLAPRLETNKPSCNEVPRWTQTLFGPPR